MVNRLHIDTVLARGGHGQDFGRLGRKFRAEDDDPVAPDDRMLAPWVALAYDGSPAAAAESKRILDEVELASLPPQGAPSGPDYTHYWIDKVRPGLARLWPLPWPGRYDRAGWRTILVSWLLMLLIAALAVLIAILIFRNQPPQTPPPPTGGSGSPPPSAVGLAAVRIAPVGVAPVRVPVGLARPGHRRVRSRARRPGHRRRPAAGLAVAERHASPAVDNRRRRRSGDPGNSSPGSRL